MKRTSVILREAAARQVWGTPEHLALERDAKEAERLEALAEALALGMEGGDAE